MVLNNRFFLDSAQNASLRLWRTTGAHIMHRPFARIALTGLPYPLLNKIITRGSLEVDTLSDLMKEPKLASVPYSWMIAKRTKSFDEKLASNGFFPSMQMTSMYFDLSKPLDQVSHHVGPSLDFKPMLKFWTDCFDFSEKMADSYFAYIKPHFHNRHLRQYFAYDGDTPIGCSWLYLERSTAALFYVGTKPSHRRQGVATSLLHKLLSEAKKAGCKKAFLTSLPQAKNLYIKLGFEQLEEYTLFMP